MTYDDLLQYLRERKALIVHFSHHSNMRPGGQFPDDLVAAAANSHVWPLSCCVVWPGHPMRLPGSVGIVLRPRSSTSVVKVGAGDIGANTIAGVQVNLGKPLTEATFEETFAVAPGSYNEWRMQDCDAVGVYIEGNPLAAKRPQVFRDEEGNALASGIGVQPIDASEVFDAFPDMPVYTMCGGEIMAVRIPPEVIYS